MRGYEANNCRLCEKGFCCENCRIKHEIDVHKVFPYCDICVYGQIYVGNIENSILTHLENSHLPLHCVYCKRIFKSVEEILLHRKCPILQHKEDSPKTPFRGTTPILISSEDNQSPILLDLQGQEHLKYLFNLITSTPMQKQNEIDIFDKSKEPLTPVDKPSSIVTSKSIIKNINSLKSENSSNRRVTFGTTPSLNSTVPKTAASEVNKNGNKENVKPNEECPAKVNTDINGKISNINIESDLKTSNFDDVKDDDTESAEQYFSHMFTPSVGTKSDVFYSAKSEKYQHSELSPNDDGNTRPAFTLDGFTPVSNANKIPKVHCPLTKREVTTEESPEPQFSNDNIKNDNYDVISMNLCTPEITNNVRREVKTDKDMPPIIENSKESNVSGTDHEHPENEFQPIQETMWLSAINPEGSNIVDTNEGDCVSKTNEVSVIIQSPSLKKTRRVSIVNASPIVKMTNVKMKFQFPTHLASTPIINNNSIKIKSSAIEVTQRVLPCQTPFKTPQGKLFEIVQRRLGQSSNLYRKFSTLPAIEPSTSNDENNSVANTNNIIERNTSAKIDNDPSNIKSRQSESQTSISSMTESSLWTSMTKIVRSVLGFPQSSQETSSQNTSVAFKRQFCDTDQSDDCIEAPSKRFKLTDIKCRRPIRETSSTAVIRKSSLVKPALASLEIVRSVSTVYGGETIRIQYDKATQTDDYLLYDWTPKN